MKFKLVLLSVALTGVFSNAALAMTKAEYKTEKDTITGTYKVSREIGRAHV